MYDVSIIISTFNNKQSIEKCINSIICNSWGGRYKYQLIVVDDGSKDGTKEYLKVLEKEEKIILISKDFNEGTLLSRIDGANKAIGKYITFVDADDLMIDGIDKRLDEIFAIKADIMEFCFNYCYADGHKENKEKTLPAGKVLQSKDYVKNIIECEFPVALWHRYYSYELIKRVLNGLEKVNNFRKSMVGNVLDDHFLSPIIFNMAESYYISNQFNYDYTIFSDTSVQKKRMLPKQINQCYLRYKFYLRIIKEDSLTKYLKKKKANALKSYYIYRIKWTIKKVLKMN